MGSLMLLVDDALQEPGAERQAVAVFHELLHGVAANLDGFPRLREGQRELSEIMFGDGPHFIVRERIEQHDVVDPVPELRGEPAFELAHDFALHLRDPDAA